jgi:hypothetical protein
MHPSDQGGSLSRPSGSPLRASKRGEKYGLVPTSLHTLQRMTGNDRWQVPEREARGFLELPGASLGGAILREVFVELLI